VYHKWYELKVLPPTKDDMTAPDARSHRVVDAAGRRACSSRSRLRGAEAVVQPAAQAKVGTWQGLAGRAACDGQRGRQTGGYVHVGGNGQHAVQRTAAAGETADDAGKTARK
jgi:hypothetical protein